MLALYHAQSTTTAVTHEVSGYCTAGMIFVSGKDSLSACQLWTCCRPAICPHCVTCQQISRHRSMAFRRHNIYSSNTCSLAGQCILNYGQAFCHCHCCASVITPMSISCSPSVTKCNFASEAVLCSSLCCQAFHQCYYCRTPKAKNVCLT